MPVTNLMALCRVIVCKHKHIVYFGIFSWMAESQCMVKCASRFFMIHRSILAFLLQFAVSWSGNDRLLLNNRCQTWGQVANSENRSWHRRVPVELFQLARINAREPFDFRWQEWFRHRHHLLSCDGGVHPLGFIGIRIGIRMMSRASQWQVVPPFKNLALAQLEPVFCLCLPRPNCSSDANWKHIKNKNLQIQVWCLNQATSFFELFALSKIQMIWILGIFTQSSSP